MSGRKMYSTKFKLEVVQRYLKGDIGLNSLAREYHISSKACIQDILLCFIFEILNFAIFISPFYLNQQVASHLIHDSETIRRSG